MARGSIFTSILASSLDKDNKMQVLNIQILHVLKTPNIYPMHIGGRGDPDVWLQSSGGGWKGSCRGLNT